MTQKLKGQDMLLEEKKVNFRGFRVFNFALYPKPETRTFRKVFFLLKILTAVVTFSKFVFSRERERERESEALFFVTFNMKLLFPENFIKVPQVGQRIWGFSCSILIFSSALWVF